jgi:hypothetical protein
MYSLWSLPAMALAVPMYAVWRIKQSCTRGPHDKIPSVLEPPVDFTIVPESAGEQTRLIRWISVREFMTVLAGCGDLIVIGIREDTQWVPFPIPATFVLPVTPNELIEVLERLPAKRTVAFYGASNLSIFMIHTNPLTKDSTPLYVLEGDLSLAEVA